MTGDQNPLPIPPQTLIWIRKVIHGKCPDDLVGAANAAIEQLAAPVELVLNDKLTRLKQQLEAVRQPPAVERAYAALRDVATRDAPPAVILADLVRLWDVLDQGIDNVLFLLNETKGA